MGARIHPTAIVDPGAELGDNVEIGPWAMVGPKVTVGEGSVVGPHAILERNVRLGALVNVGAGAVIGGAPQDLKFQGEETWAEIGDETIIREYVSINRGTTASFTTSVGKRCLVMSGVHLGHDCHLADDVIVSSGTGLAGHVEVGARAIINGMVGVQQFVRIGTFVYIGGHVAVRKDVPPYCRTDGERVLGLNRVGLQRNGVSAEAIEALSAAYRTLFRSSLNVSQALAQLRAEPALIPEVALLVQFVESSERGVIV